VQWPAVNRQIMPIADHHVHSLQMFDTLQTYATQIGLDYIKHSEKLHGITHENEVYRAPATALPQNGNGNDASLCSVFYEKKQYLL